jgi:Arc/MetJ-type ribon-helix-helix transcriptional regulator
LTKNRIGITISNTMANARKLAISVDDDIIKKIDALVKKGYFPNRSKAIQEALIDKIERFEKSRLLRELKNLDPDYEQTLADESGDLNEWPEY